MTHIKQTPLFGAFRLFLFAVIGLGAGSVSAQKTTLTGRVIDVHSKEPVPFANVYVKANPTDGVSADFDGNFVLPLDYQPDIIEVSALGYETLAWKYDGRATMNFELEPSSVNLSEVVVKGSRKEDPAYALFKKVVANKPKNNHEKIRAYGAEVYNKIELDLVQISDNFKNMRINRPFQFVFEYVDSTSEEAPFLPLFLAETLSDYYYISGPKREKEHIKANKIVGDFENESVTKLLGITGQKLNPYDNWIPIVGKKFASPISDRGTNFYRYYLVDSNFIDNQWCYQIQYFPKHKGINAFTGDFWVHDTTYAIKHIRLQILDEVHLNYIEKLSIVQYFDRLGDSLWVPTKDFITVSTSKLTEPLTGGLGKKLHENSPGAQAKRTTTYRFFTFDEQLVRDKIESEIEVAQDATQKDDAFWEAHRHEALSQSEQTAYFLVDTIKSLPVVEQWQKILYAVYEGYVLMGPVDVGNFYTLYSQNDIEGPSFKVGVRTSENLSKKYWLAGYLAYGVKDQRFKHGLNFLYMIDVSPRETFSANYWNDYFTSPYLRQDFSFSEDGFLSTYLFRNQSIPYKLLSIRSFDAGYYKEWPVGLSFKLEVANRFMEPKFNFAYKTGKETPETSFVVSEASLTTRFAYKEKFLNGDFYRTSLGSNWPIFSVKYSKAVKDIFGGDLSYDKLEFRLTDKIKWG
ncbi:MAG: carboxypeptidase-like regulatory domain-containing protein, partial [Bacteroidetes bacterium]